MGLEIWSAGVGLPGSTVRQAQRAEQEGFDGFGAVDSQNLAADPFVELAMAAAGTTSIRLATAVTNPITRHAAAMATAAATVNAEAGGRFVLGIGRGDSSLAHLGLSPAPVPMFARYLERLQGYLRGEEVPFDTEDGGGEVRSSSELGLAGGPRASRVRWITGLPKVPVDVAATGPRVIAMAAVVADGVTLAVGVAPERVRWAIDIARNARATAGLDPSEIGLGAYVPVVVHPDRETGRALISGGVASYARFSSMQGRAAGPMDETQRGVLTAVHDAYDMNRHFTHGSPQSAVLTDDVIDMFGIAGPASYCAERLLELVELGLTKLYLLGPGIGADHEATRASRTALVTEVLPKVRG